MSKFQVLVCTAFCQKTYEKYGHCFRHGLFIIYLTQAMKFYGCAIKLQQLLRQETSFPPQHLMEKVS